MGKRKSDDALVLALACGATVESAARKAGLGERTAYRRLADPDFQKRLGQTRTEMAQRACNLVTAAGMESIKTLVTLQQDATVPPSVRRAAASSLLAMGYKLREETLLAERVAFLEQRLEETG
jgi:hypothetical protein